LKCEKKQKKKKKRSSVYRKINSRSRNPNEETKPLKLELVEFPDIFPSDISRKKRIKLVKEMANKAKDEFDRKYPNVQKWYDLLSGLKPRVSCQ